MKDTKHNERITIERRYDLAPVYYRMTFHGTGEVREGGFDALLRGLARDCGYYLRPVRRKTT